VVLARTKLEPLKLERRQLSALNTFEFWSRKLGRNTLLIGPSQFDAALILEFDPAVQTYCERPPLSLDLLPHGENDARDLDFWVHRSGGHQLGVVVFEVTRKLTEERIRRSIEVSEMPVELWLVGDMGQRRQFLRNLKHLRPYISNEEIIPCETRSKIESFLRDYREGTWRQVLTACNEDPSTFAHAISLLYFEGVLDLDISARPLSMTTWISAR